MSESLPRILWNQFGGALQMLENAIVACPAEVWGDERHPHAFWYLAFHTLWWTDYYSSESTNGFHPPAPFTLDELDPAGVLPEQIYSKDELLRYLDFGRDKNRTLIKGLTPERAQRRFINDFKNFSLLELVIYNTRHVQHHAGQLNLLLRQRTGSTPGWASLPEQDLEDESII
jgi:hypothetical protein